MKLVEKSSGGNVLTTHSKLTHQFYYKANKQIKKMKKKGEVWILF